MTEITWINCAEQMPPEDMPPDGKIIARWLTNSIPMINYGGVLASVFRSGHQHKLDWEWTAYTPEKWKELTTKHQPEPSFHGNTI